MKISISILIILLIISFKSTAQDKKGATFGETTLQEKQLSQYEKEPEAAAVVLFERGKVTVKLNKHRYLVLHKEVHKKIKVFDAKKFSEDATIDILFYHSKKNQEVISNLKAITHNGDVKSYIPNSRFYEKDRYENYKQISFTFPNVKDGSILEYTYTEESPFFHRYEWDFQDNYPKIYSEFVSEIPGNYEYRASLGGTLDFAYKNSYIKDNCFSVDGFGDAADCVYSEFIMRDIPSFKEEDYMLSSSNYISKIKYDLKQTTSFTGEKNYYTKTWEDVDKEFRFDDNMGRQLRFASFFKDKIPSHILTIEDKLERAKAVYYFIQKNFAWNGEYEIYENIDVKDAFEKKGGNVAEINLMLLNALEAAEIDAFLVLSATREYGLPTLIYPTLTEFNYAMAYLKLDEQEYYLDATNKFTPFGILPFKALNKIGRIMDFKNGSYWHPITPHNKNISYINSKLKLNESGLLTGDVEENHTGYLSVSKRDSIFSNTKEKYIEEKENNYLPFEISNYTIENLQENDKEVKEKYSIALECEEIGNELLLYPFFLSSYFNENPFKLDERSYAIEMGNPLNQILLVNIEIDDAYTISYLPENQTLKLPDNAGMISVVYLQNENTLNIRFNIKLDQVSFDPEFYPTLKDFFY